MDAETGERGEFAGRERKTQSSGGGLDAVRKLLEGATVPINFQLATNCAGDGLQVMEFVVKNDLAVTERCYAVVVQGHGGARSMAWFSPTKWECIMRLIRQKAAQGERRYQRVLRLLDRILALCIAEDVFGIAAAGAGAANEACVLSALWMVLLFKRADIYGGPFLARVEAVLAKCDKNLHCAYTNIVAERLLDRAEEAGLSRGTKVAILGAAYRADLDDARESPTEHLLSLRAERLVREALVHHANLHLVETEDVAELGQASELGLVALDGDLHAHGRVDGVALHAEHEVVLVDALGGDGVHLLAQVDLLLVRGLLHLGDRLLLLLNQVGCPCPHEQGRHTA